MATGLAWNNPKEQNISNIKSLALVTDETNIYCAATFG
jgi:hypothetical protein